MKEGQPKGRGQARKESNFYGFSNELSNEENSNGSNIQNYKATSDSEIFTRCTREKRRRGSERAGVHISIPEIGEKETSFVSKEEKRSCCGISTNSANNECTTQQRATKRESSSCTGFHIYGSNSTENETQIVSSEEEEAYFEIPAESYRRAGKRRCGRESVDKSPFQHKRAKQECSESRATKKKEETSSEKFCSSSSSEEDSTLLNFRRRRKRERERRNFNRREGEEDTRLVGKRFTEDRRQQDADFLHEGGKRGGQKEERLENEQVSVDIVNQIGYGFQNTSDSDESNFDENAPYFKAGEQPIEQNTLTLYQKRLQKKGIENLATEYVYGITVGNPSEHIFLDNMIPQLTSTFDAYLLELRKKHADGDMINIELNHPTLHSAIEIDVMELRYMDSTIIMEKVINVLHSAENIPVDNNLEILTAILKMPSGSGYKHVRNIEQDRLQKSSLITIRNNSDNFCLARAIVVAKAWRDVKDDPSNNKKQKLLKSIRNHKLKVQGRKAKKLMKRAKLNDKLKNNEQGTLNDIEAYEKVTGLSITVLSAMAQNKRVRNGTHNSQRRVHLYHHFAGDSSHYDVITKVNALLEKSFYCDKCDVAYTNISDHRCEEKCKMCYRSDCTKGRQTKCADCHRTFPSVNCYKYHKKGQN